MGIRADSRWDLSIDNQKGQRALVVEVKRKTNVSSAWATNLRRNILAHGTFPMAPFFLMVFPDRFYLWANADSALDDSGPSYTIDATAILKPYFERAGVTAGNITDKSLELIVASWLGEIMYADRQPEILNSAQPWLIESGLYAALAGGRFEHEAAA
jgi:hypothetical protein